MRIVRARGVALLRFIDREQGLILGRGNPAGVRSFGDIAKKRLRFINRQPGSGTRLLVDALLAAARLQAADINGYGAEEFTHGAVAATVASGGADAGLGLRAAAAEYGLPFVPLVRERYLVAIRTKELEHPPVVAFRRMLATPEFAERVRRFPGCTAASPGAIVKVEELIEA
jgi:molybdate-binding protein